MSATRTRAPAWLFFFLLLASCVGLIASFFTAAIEVIAGVGPNPYSALAVSSPLIVVGFIAGGTIALWRGRSWLGVMLFLPPICLGACLIYIVNLP